MIDSLHAEQTLRPALEGGEQLLWAGQPIQGLRLQSSDLFLLPFGLAVAGFVVSWEILAFRPDTPVFLRFWGIPFLLAGFHLALGRFFADASRRSQTYYGVTDRRILIRTRDSPATLKSFPFTEPFEIAVRKRPDGSGTLILGPCPPFYSRLAASGWLTMSGTQPPLFDSIPPARRVYNMLRDAQTAAIRVEA